jgi:hypothetical protein
MVTPSREIWLERLAYPCAKSKRKPVAALSLDPSCPSNYTAAKIIGHTFDQGGTMAISSKISGFIERASWIRKMFEEGTRLKAIHGEDQVFDFTLGNPSTEPPEAFNKALLNLAQNPQPGMHRYMNNA